MDRKAWIAVILCALGMALNAWWMVTHPAPTPTPVPVPVLAPAPASITPSPITPAPSLSTENVPAPVAEEKVEIKTLTTAYTFTTKGGGLLKAVLLDAKDQVILNERGKAAIGALTAAAKSYDDVNYRVVAKTDRSVAFEAELPGRLIVRKDYSLSNGDGSSDHLLDFKITLTNASGAKIANDGHYIYAGAAASLVPDEVEVPAFCWNENGNADSVATGSFREGAGFMGFGGPVLDIQKSFQRVRWGGVMSRFYATIISNKEDMPGRLWAERFLINHSADQFRDHAKGGQDYAIHGGLSLPPLELEAGAAKTYDLRLYLGAKIFRDLKAIDNTEGQADRQHRYVMFYGMFSFVSRFLVFWLRQFYDWTGNWGIAILILTFCVRGALWPVQAKSNATMKRMGLLSPKLKELQEKHKDDPAKLNAEMMRLYKDYGVNPLGGCLPMLIQIPIFFGFYSVLRYAAELRGQPFLGWVHDLAMPDTVATLNLPFALPLIGNHLDINPLPMLMGVTMFLQMKLTPQPQATDKMQQRIFMFMPFIFLFFCYNFASALALYWTGQNIFSILQAQLTRVWQKDPVLEKIKVVDTPVASPMSPTSPFGHKQKAKKDRPGAPRPGGGSTSSRGKNK